MNLRRGDRVEAFFNKETIRIGVISSVFKKGEIEMVDVCYRNCSWNEYRVGDVYLISRKQVRNS